MQQEIILASNSKARQQMLAAAGLSFRVYPAQLDEAAMRREMKIRNAATTAREVSENLARAKAEQVSGLFPDALVVGSDQVLECRGEIFSKASTRAELREQLLVLRGSAHTLFTCVVLAENGRTIWGHVEQPNLHMRQFSLPILDAYLDYEGETILESVGGYKLEGRGVSLFEGVDGDYFSILGMPLLPLLGELRQRGVLIS